MAHTLLLVHSYLRWLVVAVGLVAVARAVSGVVGARVYGAADKKAGLFFTITLDVQLLVGLVLYAVSPVTVGAMKDMAAAMHDAPTRFFVAEHPVFMLLSLVFVHVGSVLTKRAEFDRAKFVRSAVCYAAAMGLVLAGIPWWRLGGS